MRAAFLDPRREAREHSHEHEVRRNHGAWSERIDRQSAVVAQRERCKHDRRILRWPHTRTTLRECGQRAGQVALSDQV